MKSMILALVLASATAFATPTTSTTTTTMPPTQDGDSYTCTNQNGTTVATQQVCQNFVSSQSCSRADALAICGAFCSAESESTCRQSIESNPRSYCEAFSAQFCGNYVETVCGDARAVCHGNDTLLAIGITLGEVHASCDLAVDVTNSTLTVCGDVTNNLSCPACPASPDVNVGTQVLRCKRWKTKRNGVVVGIGCLAVNGQY